MTGTSCDGADLALLQVRGHGKKTQEKFVCGTSQAFPQKLRLRLREAQKGTLRIREAAVLQRDYSIWIANLCRASLQRWKIRSALIAVHGQTVWHEPPAKELGFSVQLLDPTIIAYRTGCTVLSHFR